MKTAFVTGGTGFLGANLVEQLAAAGGWRIVAIHRAGSDTAILDKVGAEKIACDLLELDRLKEVIPEGCDAVFHVAGDTSVWSRNNPRQIRANIDGTRNMITAARAAGVQRFVHTSTWNVYGHPDTKINEASDKAGDRSWINYDRTKFYAEYVVMAAARRGLDAVILNPTHIMGRYDRNNWSRMIRRLARGSLPLLPPGHGVFCHAEAVAKAHIAAAEKGRTGENYILGGPEMSFRDLAAIIGEVLGKRVPRRTMPAWAFLLAARVETGLGNLRGREPEITPEAAAMVLSKTGIATDKAERELGYVSPPVGEMVEDCYAWMRADGLL